VVFEITDVLSLDIMLYLAKISLKLRVEVFVALHNTT